MRVGFSMQLELFKVARSAPARKRQSFDKQLTAYGVVLSLVLIASSGAVVPAAWLACCNLATASRNVDENRRSFVRPSRASWATTQPIVKTTLICGAQ